jgi:hypothetical protein
MRHCFFPNISLPSSNVTKLIEDFYTSEDKKVESLSTPTRSLIIDTSYFNKEFKDTAVITFKNRPSKQQEIYLEIICRKKKPNNLDLKQVNPIKQIGGFF